MSASRYRFPMPRRYTDAELDAYELHPVVDEATGQTARYAVHIGGDQCRKLMR